MNITWGNLTDFERNLLISKKIMNFSTDIDHSDNWEKSFKYHHDLGMWNYSTNPRQAFDVLEKLINEGYVVEIKINNSKQFLCKIAQSSDKLTNISY